MGAFELRMSRRHEKEIQKEFPHSFLTSASGAKDEKTDLQTHRVSGLEFAIECKSTCNSSYSITKRVWDTLEKHAQDRSYLMRPILAIRLYAKKAQEKPWGLKEYTPENLPVELDVFVIKKDDFIEMYEDYLRLKEKDV